MRIKLDWDERYPDYIIVPSDSEHPMMELDVPDDLPERFIAAQKAYEAALGELHELAKTERQRLKQAKELKVAERGDFTAFNAARKQA